MSKFKIGDVVMFTRDSMSKASKMKKGDIGKIIRFEGDGCLPLVYLKDINNGNKGKICEDGLKKIPITLKELLE